jgi:hypothetical protein
LTVDGISEGGNLTEGFGLKLKMNMIFIISIKENVT